MLDQCAFCGYDQEALDDVPLCHWCYVAFADPDSPFCAKHLVSPAVWKQIMSDPNAKMWVQKRMKEVQ